MPVQFAKKNPLTRFFQSIGNLVRKAVGALKRLFSPTPKTASSQTSTAPKTGIKLPPLKTKPAPTAEEIAAAKAMENAQIGDVVPDGSIYAGISPNSNKRMYVTAQDAPLHATFNTAASYARRLDAHGHKDWHIPTQEELNVLFENREKGALKGTFNLTGADPSGWYWSSTTGINKLEWCQRFSDGYKGIDHDMGGTLSEVRALV